MKKRLLVIIWVCCLPWALWAGVDDELAAIQRSLAVNDWAKASQLLGQYRAHYHSQQDYLNLSYFIPYAGYVAEKKGGIPAGLAAAEALLATVLAESRNPRDFRQAWLEIHTYYLAAGKHQLAYEANQKALAFTYQIPDHRPEEWAIIERNLGVIANLMGAPGKAKAHVLRALKGFEQDPGTSRESTFNLLNDLGASYWYEAKWDSATIFWLDALRFIDQMEPTLTNQYYRKSMIESNLSAVYDVTGRPHESISRVKSSIELIQHFIANAQQDTRWDRAFTSLFYSMANLAAVYKSIGHYQQALQVHEYTLREKEKRFEAGHPEITETLIQVGRAHYSLQNFSRANTFLERALAALAETEGDYFIQLADVHYALARNFEATRANEQAKQHYLQADAFFSKALQNQSDYVYLGFLADASHFFSRQQAAKPALEFARKGLDYLTKVDGRFTMAGFNQLLNLGEVHYNLGNYTLARQYATESLNVLETIVKNANGTLDAIRIEFDKPQAILLRAKADYQLEEAHSISFLQEKYTQLKEAYEVFTRRKSILGTSEDIAALEVQSHALLVFMKKILLGLYEKTGDRQYLEDLMVYQESGVYFRIRSRLNQAGMVAYGGVPPEVLEKETLLKTQLGHVFEGEGGVSDFFRLTEEWQALMDNLQVQYPLYYQAHYALVGKEDIAVPHHLQAVRYFFVESALYAMVYIRGEMHLFPLQVDEALLGRLAENWGDEKAFSALGHALYQQLWQPFAHLVQGEKVLIVPDEVLFNLSFDMLPFEKITSFRELAQKSLLARHALHYRYSLSALRARPGPDLRANYVAFVPGFFDAMKEKYRNAVKDSTLLDKAYLSLLPQPFTLKLVEKVSWTFGGDQFVHEASTPAVFKAKAGNHKIIHIGTHAESDNVSPAFSRLIFAKTTEGQLDGSDHAIYAYELYETNLSARLAILTACETAKPVYQPGEGMISLSHAFRYSGSESLLTSLWKIDEKASNQITGEFLMHLKNGLPKDEALRQAKLTYLQQAQGRTLSPQYWAGLVLMGDPDPIEGLARPVIRYGWLLLALVCLAVLWAVGRLLWR